MEHSTQCIYLLLKTNQRSTDRSSLCQDAWVIGANVIVRTPASSVKTSHRLPATVPGVLYCQIKDSPLTSLFSSSSIFTTLWHVKADLSFLTAVCWKENVPFRQWLKKKKNKGACSIFSGLFCYHRQHHIICLEGQQWGGFGRSRGFTNSKLSKCG